MGSLNDRDRELVAVGAAIGAGCRPCTQHHVRAALESGLSLEEVRKAVDTAHVIRSRAGDAVAALGRRLLGGGESRDLEETHPTNRDDALIHLGAAAGCNAGTLLADYLRAAQELEIRDEELNAAVEAARAVKKGAAMFMDREAERALRPMAGAGTEEHPAASECGCGPDCP